MTPENCDRRIHSLMWSSQQVVGSDQLTDLPNPSFERPPVAEVALAAYFTPPLPLHTIHLGKLAILWETKYPRVDDQPPLPPVPPEAFPAPISMPFQLMGGYPGARVWFTSAAGDRLIQVQRDRIVLNWRRQSPEDPYPRYDTLRPEFEEAVSSFVDFFKDEGLGLAAISQAEVTYSNPIPKQELGDPALHQSLVAPWSGVFSTPFLPPPEDVRLSMRFLIPEPGGTQPCGRLYVETASATFQGADGSPPNDVLMLQLFARGRPLGEGIDGALAFLDLGHDWVVNGFVSLTTSGMHTNWGIET